MHPYGIQHLHDRQDIDDDESDHEDFETEEDFEQVLMDALEEFADDNEIQKLRCRTFRDVGMLTDNSGIVVTIGKVEFQVQIIRSR